MATKHPAHSTRWQKLRSTESVFAVVGGLIVLGSFIIKDVLQERIRNNIASLERAVDVFDMGNQFAGISDQLDSASNTLKGGDSEMDQRLGFDRYGTRLEYYSNFGGRAELVYESVPRSWRTDAPMKAILEKVKNFGEVTENYQHNFSQLNDLRAKHAEQQIDEKIRQLDSSERLTGWQISELTQLVQREALNEIERKRRLLERWTVGSYVAFAAGWILAIVGKLFHIPGLAPE